ncbi:hypothetical protein HOH11_01270 [Candidatus Woesearchaeota archaeon]|jgi:hypothetical protein|nr:hypothetical protein [Candidatus Woesearchaeota archaeon]MBT6023214.1 hypothetical protein [Candidatus Woesearchaeota archaeon]
MRLVKMNFNIENQAISVLNDTPYSVYNQNTESIPLWTGRSTMPRINLASAETLVNRIAKVDPTLIKDIGKDNLILNLNEHTDRMYNKVSRSAKGEYIDEILESLNERLPYVFLPDICNKPSNGSKTLEAFSVASFLAYHDNPTNNEQVNRKSKITNDRRHFRRNLEAHLGLHTFRDEELKTIVTCVDGMLRNEGYPSENKQGFFRKHKGYLEEPDDVLRVLFEGQLNLDGFNYLRHAQFLDENGFAQSRDGRDAIFINRYNRPDSRIISTANRETSKMMNRLKKEGSNLVNGKLFAEAQKLVIEDTIKRDRL